MLVVTEGGSHWAITVKYIKKNSPSARDMLRLDPLSLAPDVAKGVMVVPVVVGIVGCNGVLTQSL